MVTVTYRRAKHAAHYDYSHPAKGHDLEQWDVAGDLPHEPRTGNPIAPPEVPRDAEYHSGYLARDGVQHWLFVRTAPLTGTCVRCCATAQEGATS
jgi:hypothetical protein